MVSMDAVLRDDTVPVGVVVKLGAARTGERLHSAQSLVMLGDSGFLRTRTPLGRLIVLCEVSGELCLFGQVDGHIQHSKRDPLLEPVLVNTPRRRGCRTGLHGAPHGVERGDT